MTSTRGPHPSGLIRTTDRPHHFIAIGTGTVTRRIAQKKHPCSWGSCGYGGIQPGEAYLEWKEFPGGDGGGYADHAGRPVRIKICGRCSVSTGHDFELDPPPNQAYALGVV